MRESLAHGIHPAMEQQATFHIVGGTERFCIEQARAIFALGHHAEVYGDLAELVERRALSGLVLAGGEVLEAGLDRLIETLGAAGLWLPVVGVSDLPCVPQIVRAIEEGAIDFLALPLAPEEIARVCAKVSLRARRQVDDRRRMAEARRLLGRLSPRERQVLDGIALGSSNKLIARALTISPRTVEIHRANMMAKLGIAHSAEAVRLQYFAGFAPRTSAGAEGAGLPVRLVHEDARDALDEEAMRMAA